MAIATKDRFRHRLLSRRWLWLLIAVLLAGGWGATPLRAQGQAPPPDLPAYESWLREALAAAQRGDRLGLEQVAPRLIGVTEVVAGDARVPVNNSWLREALARPDPDLRQVAARLGALLDALAQPDTAAPADATRRLDAILSQPPFAAPPSESLLARFFDWLGRQLARLFDPIADIGPGPASALGWLFAAISVLLVGGVLVYWLLSLRRSLAPEARLTAAADPDANLTASAALSQAAALARGGDYRTAVRYLYLSSLLWLDERRLLRYDRALTNREYLEHLADNPELRERLRPIVETFDRVWYGYAPLDAESFAAYQQQVERLRAAKQGGG